MTEHTPTPWQSNGPYLYGSGEVRYVRIGRAMPEPDIIGRTICEIGLWLDMPEEQEANGTFIVLAANCHEELVAALKWIDTYLANQPLDQQAKFLIIEKVKDALAKAKGE